MAASKKPDLYALAKVLGATTTPYVLIGGVALQIHQREPRTTLDIDIAVHKRGDLPSEALIAAGFKQTGKFEYSDNWVGPHGFVVRFADDPAFAKAIATAQRVTLDDTEIRVITAIELVRAKLRASNDVARRKSKRMQDLADVQALFEQDPELEQQLTEVERQALRF
jgi:hypothetical protein